MEKKITKATLKSFIKKNQNLWIKQISSFETYDDCTREVKNSEFKSLDGKFGVMPNNNEIIYIGYNYLNGKTFFKKYDDGKYSGFYCADSCSSFIVAAEVQ